MSGDVSRTIADDFAFALRNVRNLDDRGERFAAYSAAAIQTGEHTKSEIDAADTLAVAIELSRRVS